MRWLTSAWAALLCIWFGTLTASSLPAFAGGSPPLLSDDARNLLAGLKPARTINVEAFISPDVPESYNLTRKLLIETLGQIDGLNNPMVRVQIHDAERFGVHAARARERFGITPRSVTTMTRTGSRTDDVFLGVAVTCGYEKAIVSWVRPDTLPEYDLVRAISAIGCPDRKTLGVLVTDAQLLGGSNRKAWRIVEELRSQYKVVPVDPTIEALEKVDVLLAVQPSSLGPKELEHFIEAIRAGQPTAIFEDPFPILASAVPATIAPRHPEGFDPKSGNPMLGMFGSRPRNKGDIRKLWQTLGVDFVSDRIVWQDYNPFPTLEHLPREFLFVDSFSGGRGRDDQSSPITSGIRTLLFPFAGSVTAAPASQIEFEPLVQTGNRTGTVAYREIRPMGTLGVAGSLNSNRRHTPTGDSYVLAARIRGTAAAPSSTEPPSQIDVVLVAETDILCDEFIQIRQEQETPEHGVRLDFDNIDFVCNALDVLAGDPRFMGIRKRRLEAPVKTRTPQEIADARQRAEQRQKILEEHKEAVENEQRAMDTELDRLRQRVQTGSMKATEVQVQQESLARRLEVKKEQLKRRLDERLGTLRWGKADPDRERRPKATDVRDLPLFPDFVSIDAVACLEILRHDELTGEFVTIRLVQDGQRWSIASHHDYPADAENRMTLVMKAFQELTAVDSVAAGAADYSEYRVADPDLFPSDTTNTGFGTLVRMKDAGGSVLLAVVIGKSVPGNAQLRYVRRVDSDDVFTAAISAELISTSMKDWADRNLLKIDPTRIKQVRILNALVDASRGQYLPQCRMIWEHDDEADPEWSLVWLEEFHGQKWKPVTLDNEAELEIASLDALKKTLATLEPVELIRKTPALSKSLSATGTWNTQDAEELRALQEQGFYVVQQSNELQLLAQEGQIRVLVEDGVEYLLRFGRSVGASGDRCLFVTARFNHGLDLRAEPSAEESRPKPEQLGAGEERVRELNGQFGHWFYVISDDSFRKLRPGLGDIAPAK